MYREHGRVVYAVAYRMLGDQGLAEEATQRAFTKAWRAAATLDETRDIAPWLVAIARRVAIDIHRRESIRRADQLDDVPEGEPTLVSTPASAEQMYDAWEVRRAVAELPEDEQQVVRLQHFGGFTHTEVAEQLGVAVGTVKSRSFRAHKHLATMLGHLKD